MPRTQIWSSGGGVQSTAIAALICMGELKPDLSIIVDTERELSTTWQYLDRWILPALEAACVTLSRVKKSDYSTVDLLANKSGEVLIPAFTSHSGSVGKLPTYCSTEWKKRVMQRWATEQGVKQADIWLGMTVDELQRVTQPTGKWQHRYPLIERRMTRGDCIALAKRMGWPEPPRSSCWMCPNKGVQGFKWQRDNAPADFAKAAAFERQIQDEDPDLWLTDQAIPLAHVDFDDDQQDLFNASRCDSGYCFN